MDQTDLENGGIIGSCTHADEQGASMAKNCDMKPDQFRVTKLYDRQIRLWGWEAQQRLMNSRVLLSGLNGVGAEVLKNLLLGGVRQIIIMDSVKTVQADFSSNFFLRNEHIGFNRASSSAENAKLLNPTSTLTAVEFDVSAVNEDFIRGFDLVLLNNAPISEAIRIGTICRAASIPIFVSQVIGYHAFYINDLEGLKFEIPPVTAPKPVPVTQKPLVDINEASTSRGSYASLKVSQNEPTELLVNTVDIGTVFSKETARRSGQAAPSLNRMFGLKKVDPYLNLEILLTFLERVGRYPSFEFAADDQEMLSNIRNEVILVGDTRVFDVSEFVTSEANFTCAMLGGTLAQEIITVLTRRGYPIFNFYYLAAMDAIGTREYLQ